jgi:UDP-4-amino-4,6-dideoxy-N-acetyl-beta-L-altrosamine transaminase
VSGRPAPASAALPLPEPIPYARQSLDEADIAAVVAVLRSDWLTQGPVGVRFERALAAHANVAHALATNSATAALHLACLALGLGPGDRLWTSPNTFVASANCARYCGAEVDFVDIDPRTYNLSAEALAEKLAAAERSGTLPKIVVAVHFAGQSCDMRALHALAQRYGFSIIEDASHAVGGRYLDAPIGNCRYSDITVFSFHPVKIITSGEGGAALTNDAALYARMALLRSHGVTRDPALLETAAPGDWYYEQQALGFNYRLTDIQAALGLSQLARLEQFIARRRAIAAHYDSLLADLAVVTPWQQPDTASAWHLYPVCVTPESRREIFGWLRRAGIEVNVHYLPVYRQPYYRALGFREGYCPNAERYYAAALSLPMFPALADEDVVRVAQTLRTALTRLAT